MKLAIFIKATTHHKGYGGLETQNKVLCEGLAERGHNVTVFSPAREIGPQETLENGVKYVFVPCTYRMLFASFDKGNWYTKSYTAFLSQHQTEPFDVVISQSSAALGIIKQRDSLGIKVVGISHGTIGGEMKTILNSAKSVASVIKSTKSLLFGLVNFFGRQRQYIHGCNKIVAVSNAVKDSIVNETYANPEKITVIHNGIDPAKVPQRNWEEKEEDAPFKVLYIGRVEESKGLYELVCACKDLENVFLNIVGDGPFLEPLKILTRELKMSQRTLFYGKLPHDKTLEMYSCNNVFVLPTKRVEGLPMTLVEACFAGLPIITTNMGGNKDAVEDQFNGFLLRDSSKESIQSHILRLARDKKGAKSMGANGRIKAQKEFTLAGMLDSYERVLKTI